MYSYFNGIIKDISIDSVTIDVNDIGYNIYMAEDDINKLKLEEKVLIYTYFQHREDDMRLFGFLEKSRLQFFKKLITVSGVGSKLALGIISNISVEDMCSAIATENIIALKYTWNWS
jgi:Holliday junction DNA helicase RuvA